jgi:hypothetical protein
MRSDAPPPLPATVRPHCPSPPPRPRASPVQFMDDQLQFNRMDFIKLAAFEEVLALEAAGYAYAQRTDAAGGFRCKLDAVRFPPEVAAALGWQLQLSGRVAEGGAAEGAGEGVAAA